METSSVDDETWRALLIRDDYMCLKCNSETELQPAHYISRGAHRDNRLENLMLLCFQCHRALHDGKMKVRRIQGHFYFSISPMEKRSY